tara:strand:+ start:490 stop:1431 length:942 start_codon:yes stop_codon:yes gene_type:complete
MNANQQEYIMRNYPEIAYLNEPLKKHSTFGIGGYAKVFLLPNNKKQIKEILRYSKKNNIKIFFIGSGSNLLFSDDGFDGIIISLKKTFKNLEIDDSGRIVAGSGVILVKMVTKAINKNIKGLETLSGVPGTLGGALYMNAGAYGSEISNYFISAKFLNMNGDEFIITNKDVAFSYRKSNFPKDCILIEAEFNCKTGDSQKIKDNKNKFSKSRKNSQPLQYRSAGSVFKNPSSDIAAGYLIDQSGLKGTKMGDALISEKHANFIVNLGSASSEDVIYLIKLIKKKVLEKFKISLELEIKLIGFSESLIKDVCHV